MPLRYTGFWRGIYWAVWEIREKEEFLRASVPLSGREQAYIDTITHPRRRLESLAARAALFHLPSLSYTSLSHSYPWAGAACAPFPVGIDIERWRFFPEKVKLYFTNTLDRELLHGSDFTYWHIWSAKEVAYKLLCAEFDKLSFRRELFFQGKWIRYHRGERSGEVPLGFWAGESWLLTVGYLLEKAVYLGR
ncbi:MAG: 4'-phosphopantetheinyl transferase superfamily protein [Bacteroidia bacterium]|nr:4'-phosphopantetheinyl transferase superfamily protein [Bacteroidia bacterium]